MTMNTYTRWSSVIIESPTTHADELFTPIPTESMRQFLEQHISGEEKTNRDFCIACGTADYCTRRNSTTQGGCSSCMFAYQTSMMRQGGANHFGYFKNWLIGGGPQRMLALLNKERDGK